MRPLHGYLLALVLFGSSVLVAEDGLPDKKLDELKAATVYVKVEGKQGGSSGSGFLIHVAGETGLVATNRHVVAAVPGRFTPQKYSVVFWSGTKKEQSLPGELIALDPEQDLAVLKVTAKNLPAPLNLAQTAKPRETMTVYTLGFPLGDFLTTNKSNPSITIGRGTISSLREDERGRLQRVQLDGELNPGNSGGPVVTDDGQLVGIAVSKVVGTRISFAIPPGELTELLKGRAAPALVRSVRVDAGAAEVEVEIPLADPLRKLKTVELRHVRKDALKEAPQVDKEGNWPNLTGAEKVGATIEGGKAVARITLKSPEKKPLDWYFQAAYTNGEGKSLATQPRAQTIDFGGSGTLRPVAPAGGAWEVVTSKEGGFTVDMPVKPTLNMSSTRKIATGTVRVLMLGCDTEKGAYLAFRVDIPTAVAKGSEEQVLDAQRNFFAEEWKGKVVREKKVLARGNVGRDFTIQGKPEGMGVSTIRVRQYLVGKSVFALAVLSPANGDLPEDAGRFLGSLALGEAKVRATGTPEPEPKGTELAGWGLAIDPDKDCKLTPGPKSMGIEVPAAMHDFGGPLRKFNAPRVMREVDGDFVATVKVVGDFKPGPKSTNPKGIPYLAAGILLWSDSDNFIRLERAALLRGGKVLPHVAFLEQEGGYGGAVHNEGFREGPCWLRMERKGSQILGAISGDGLAWKQLKPIDTVWPGKLKVGVMAISTSSEPFSVRLEEFELKTK